MIYLFTYNSYTEYLYVFFNYDSKITILYKNGKYVSDLSEVSKWSFVESANTDIIIKPSYHNNVVDVSETKHVIDLIYKHAGKIQNKLLYDIFISV